MSKYLLKEELIFRCDMEEEAKQLVNHIKLKRDVVSHEIKRIEKKDDIYFKVKIKSIVNDEKNPTDCYITM